MVASGKLIRNLSETRARYEYMFNTKLLDFYRDSEIQ